MWEHVSLMCDWPSNKEFSLKSLAVQKNSLNRFRELLPWWWNKYFLSVDKGLVLIKLFNFIYTAFTHPPPPHLFKKKSHSSVFQVSGHSHIMAVTTTIYLNPEAFQRKAHFSGAVPANRLHFLSKLSHFLTLTFNVWGRSKHYIVFSNIPLPFLL